MLTQLENFPVPISRFLVIAQFSQTAKKTMKIFTVTLLIAILMVALAFGKVRKSDKKKEKEVRYYGHRPPANGTTWTYVAPSRPYGMGWWVARPPRPATQAASAGAGAANQAQGAANQATG